MESKGVVRKFFEEKGQLLVSFPNHDGYFHAPADDAGMRAKITESRDSKKELSFTFDKDLKILSIR